MPTGERITRTTWKTSPSVDREVSSPLPPMRLRESRRGAAAVVSALDQAVDQRAELDARLLRRLGEQAARGEAGEGVDFQQVGVVGLVDHHVDARQVAAAG